MYYLDDWVDLYKFPREDKFLKGKSPDKYKRNSRYVKIIKSYEFFDLNPEFTRPNYILFYDDKNFEERFEEANKYFSSLEYEATIEPSAVDVLMRKINPTNANKTIYIYKTGKQD